jgi:hypothetical protein
MRLGEALKDYAHTHVLAEATLTRLGLTDEAAMITTDEGHNLTGVVVACHKGLVVFTVSSTQTGGVRRSLEPMKTSSPFAGEISRRIVGSDAVDPEAKRGAWG